MTEAHGGNELPGVEINTVRDGGAHGAKNEMLPQLANILLEFMNVV